jgi:type IV secretion system protein VirB10
MVLRQGKVISAVLESRVVSDLPGVIRAVVDEPVYAEDGRALLIGPGARLIGQYRSGLRTGDSRVFVVWDRLIRSDGSSVQLASPGVDELGVSGVTGDVDSRFVERFGAAAMISLIDAGVASQSNETTINLSQDGSSAAALALQDSLNIQPRITIDQGARISIMLARDVGFESVGAEPSRVAGR